MKDALLQKYLATVKERIGNFDSVEIPLIPREENTRADVLSKLASTRVSRINHSFLQKALEKPSYRTSATTIAVVEPAPRTWMIPIKEYIEEGKLPDDPMEAKTVYIQESQKKLARQFRQDKRSLSRKAKKASRLIGKHKSPSYLPAE